MTRTRVVAVSAAILILVAAALIVDGAGFLTQTGEGRIAGWFAGLIS